MGTSAYMMTEVMLRERLGELRPEGVALGPGGEPTRDPAAARRGALLPFGGYKGFGLAFMMQASAARQPPPLAVRTQQPLRSGAGVLDSRNSPRARSTASSRNATM